MIPKTPHKEKLLAAIENPKCKDDVVILKEALKAYEKWISDLTSLKSIGKNKVLDMTRILNGYKDFLEVDLIAGRGSAFIKRQKGQLKLDNSVMEEFLMYLVDPSILKGLPPFELECGPQKAFMSLSFRPAEISQLNGKPDVVLKVKDQDFTIGKALHYKFSPDPKFEKATTNEGSFFLTVLAAECKVNYDKTMFQECAGTASRLKQGCPISRYYALVEFLDMEPEDVRLTDINNVYLIRHAKRLPYEKRAVFKELSDQHRNFPIDGEIIYKFVLDIQNFIDAVWYDPAEALRKGSFI